MFGQGAAEHVDATKQAKQTHKRKSVFFWIPGLILLLAGGGVNVYIYNYYEHLPISFYINQGLDPRAPIALAMDKPTLLVYNLSSLAVFIGFILLTVGLGYYMVAKGYSFILGFLPLLSLVVGFLIIASGSHVLAGLVEFAGPLLISLILAKLPNKSKKIKIA